MARSKSFLSMVVTCMISSSIPSAHALSAAMQAAQLVGLLPRASTGCSNSGYTACNQDGLPGNFCCPTGESCFVFNAAQSVICCPAGKDCSSISTISCDLSLQNATANPTSPLFTTQLQNPMNACGSGCCPSGMSCKNGQTCVANPPSSSSASSLSSTSTPPPNSLASSSTSVSQSAASSPTSSDQASPAAASHDSGNGNPAGSTSTNAHSNQFPTPAILVGFFSGLVTGIILTAFLICCFGRSSKSDRASQHSDFSNLTANISDPIYQDGTSRADFLRRESKSRDGVSRTERVKSFFRTPTVRSHKSQAAMIERCGTATTSRTQRSSVAPPKTPSTLRHQASGESITIYSPPNLQGPPNMPMPSMMERNTTVGSIVEKADAHSKKGSPPNTDFEKMLAEVGWKTGQPYLGSPGMVDPRSRRCLAESHLALLEQKATDPLEILLLQDVTVNAAPAEAKLLAQKFSSVFPLSLKMPIPIALAAPALLAGGAWLTAKTQLDYDIYLIGGLVRLEYNCSRRHKSDRLNFFYVLEEHATSKSSAERTFLIFEGREWTYKQVYETVIKCGTWLKYKYAIEKGEIVAMDFMNGPTFMFLLLGLWSIGAYPAFINYNLTAEPLLHTIKTSTARVLLVDEEIRPKFTQKEIDALRSQNIEAVFFNTAIEQEILDTQGAREPDSRRAGLARSGIAALIYTSGTTGLPKAAVVSWQKLWFAPTMVHWTSMKTTDRLYTCMPLYHSSALILCALPALFKGATLVLGRRFSTSTFWPEVRQHEATMIQYVGETCRYLLGAKPQVDPDTGANLDKVHNVRLAFGNGLRPDVWERFKARFGIESIGEFYSATEGVSASWNFSSNTFATGAIGRNGVFSGLILGKGVAVVEVDWSTETPSRDPKNQNFCTKVKTGEPGEVLYRLDPANPNPRYQGYFNNAGASNSKILRDVFVKGDVFFRTGDIMRWDHEGRWYFCDRIGDTFRWKSENISTAEVGEALGMHPRILEANVYGVEVPHHDGRAGCAAVLFSEGEGPINEQLLEDVAKHANAKLPRYAVPTFLRVVKEIVATGNNKQQKAGLRKEGINLSSLGEDKLLWLRNDKYVPFEREHWQDLYRGSVKL